MCAENSSENAGRVPVNPDGSQRDELGQTALHRAAMAGDLEAVRSLLHGKADVNAKSRRGYTPLHCAVISQRTDTARLKRVVHLLLASGANLNARDAGGRTPLHVAAVAITRQLGIDHGVVKTLLDSGAQVNERDDGGWTAL